MLEPKLKILLLSFFRFAELTVKEIENNPDTLNKMTLDERLEFNKTKLEIENIKKEIGLE